MGKTYKDRRGDLPRVPSWARPKPTRVHKNKKKQNEEDKDLRETYLEELWEKE